jgi:hypothetical protein
MRFRTAPSWFMGEWGFSPAIRNLFEEDYWGEVREEGIMPALPRNYYSGVEIFF